jgi:hypothetical protein
LKSIENMINNHKYVFNPPLSFSIHNTKETLKKASYLPKWSYMALFIWLLMTALKVLLN